MFIPRRLRSARIALVAACISLGTVPALWSAEAIVPPLAVPAATPTAPDESLDVQPFQDLVRQIILDELKPQYEDRKHWGQQGRVITGVKVKGKWFEPHLEKRTKEVNDGLWQRYVVALVEPEKNLHVRLDQARSIDPNRFAFSLELQCKLRGEAHIERWRKGVKMLNTSAQGDMTVRVRLDCDLAVRLEPGKLVRDVVLDPRVTAVDLQLVDLDLRRVGVLGHDIAHELGDSLRPIIAHELDEREAKIVAKANTSIDKRRDRLRFSLTDFLKSGWSKFQTTLAKAPLESKSPSK